MNESTKVTLGVFVGGVVGALAAHLITKSLLNKRHEDELEEMKEYYKGRQADKDIFFNPDEDAEENYKRAKNLVEVYELIQTNDYGPTPDSESPPYEPPKGKLVKSENPVEIEPEEEEEDFSNIPSGNIFRNELELSGYVKIDDQPYLITRAEFEEVEFEYETNSLTWYLKDEVLAEDLVRNGNAEIDDVERVIGSRHLEMFGRASGDPDVFFIRNEANGTKYEVTRVDAYYQEVVLGLAPEDIQG